MPQCWKKTGINERQIRNWTNQYLANGEAALEPKKKLGNPLSRYERRKELTYTEHAMYAEIQAQTDKHSLSELCMVSCAVRYYKWLRRSGQLNRFKKAQKLLDVYIAEVMRPNSLAFYARAGNKGIYEKRLPEKI